MKRIISLFMCVIMVASLLFAILVTNVNAAGTITDEALFMTYPTYLSNNEMDEGLSKAEAAYYAVINSYSKTDSGATFFRMKDIWQLQLTLRFNLGRKWENV